MRCVFATICILLTMAVASTTIADDLPLRGLSEQQTLVLRNGRVVKGRLLPRPDGVEVILPSGRMFIGNEQIRLQARSLEEAFFKLQAKRPQTVEGFVTLAQWCINNQLHSHAKKEVLNALHLDPQRLQLRNMLESLTAKENAAQTIKSQLGTPEELREKLQHVHMRDRRAIAGLPEHLAAVFTKQVQPILSNKCSNTKCHGSENEGFYLQSVRRGTNNIRTEQNLAEVMKYLQTTESGETGLLHFSRNMHGGMRKQAFAGRIGRSQLQTLQNWVQQIQVEYPSLQRTVSSNATHSNTNQHNNAGNSRVGNSNAVQSKAANSKTQSFNAALDEREQEFLSDAKAAIRADAFDPDVFNLKYHGRRRSQGYTTASPASVRSSATYSPIPVEGKPTAKGSKP